MENLSVVSGDDSSREDALNGRTKLLSLFISTLSYLTGPCSSSLEL